MQDFISKLFLGVYLFALFTQITHHHVDHAATSPNSSFLYKKQGNSDVLLESKDCLYCNYVVNASSLPLEEFHFVFYTVVSLKEKVFNDFHFTNLALPHSYFLRGPPVN